MTKPCRKCSGVAATPYPDSSVFICSKCGHQFRASVEKPNPRVTAAYGEFRMRLGPLRLEDYLLKMLLLDTKADAAVSRVLVDAVYHVAASALKLAVAAEEYADALCEQEGL